MPRNFPVATFALCCVKIRRVKDAHFNFVVLFSVSRSERYMEPWYAWWPLQLSVHFQWESRRTTVRSSRSFDAKSWHADKLIMYIRSAHTFDDSLWSDSPKRTCDAITMIGVTFIVSVYVRRLRPGLWSGSLKSDYMHDACASTVLELSIELHI